jgi:hypothetical protein
MIGKTGGRPSPPAVKTTVASPVRAWMSLGRPSGPATPVNASPTAIALISMLLVPTPWTTRQMVPAAASQSASVRGMSSPSGRGSTRTN